jgi:predicted transcriptional regulator
MNTRVVTAHLPVDLADKMDRIAAEMDRPRGWIVKQALAAWIDREEWRDRLTREAMAELDAGHVVEGDVVSTWVDSLGTENPLPKPRP